MPETYNPIQVEEALRDCANRIAKGINVRDRCFRDFQEADRSFKVAEAEAYLAATGAVKEREMKTVLATQEARGRRDDAEAKHKYAENRARALEAEQRSWQSIGASVREAYRVASVVER